MKKYKTLQEAKQVGTLYHLTEILGLLDILKHNHLKSFHYGYISTTRNKMLNRYVGSRPSAFFKLELDGDKLSHKYQIEPFAYTSATNITFSEQEEVIKTSEIINLSKYLNKIIFVIDVFEYGEYSQKDVLSGNGSNIGHGKRFYLKDLKELLNKIPSSLLYIQKGHKIYQDDNYFKNLFKGI